MKWAVLILIAIIFFLPQAYAGDWNIQKSNHFIIYYQDVSGRYLNELIRKAENYYRSITDYLGFKRFDFWTWDNRCKIYLFPNQEEYLNTTGCAEWSRGHVNVIKKEINTYVGQDEFFDAILPHEMGHIIFREFVGFEKKLPLWLDEGVACMQEADSRKRLVAAKNLIGLKIYIPLNELGEINEPELIIPLIFYSQSASIVDFLLNRFGRNEFVNFCRRLRDGASFTEALRIVYTLEDLDGLEKLWIEYSTELELPKQ